MLQMEGCGEKLVMEQARKAGFGVFSYELRLMPMAYKSSDQDLRFRNKKITWLLKVIGSAKITR